MELQGKIKTIKPIELKGANNFKTRKVMLDRTTEFEGNRRVNFTEITLLGDSANIPEQLELTVGDVVKCQFNIEGRFFEHEGQEKFAQDVKVWKMEIVNKAKPTTNNVTNNYA